MKPLDDGNTAPVARQRIRSGWKPVAALGGAAVLLVSLVLRGTAEPVSAPQKVTPPAGLVPIAVRPVGRTRLGSDGMYTFQWPGTYFMFAFRGSAAYFRVGAGRQDLHVRVDGQTSSLLTDGQAATYRIETPGKGVHRVRIDSVNESAAAPESLGGFAVAAGGQGVPVPAGARQIEFIGDSHTVGYGNMSASRTCTGEQLFAMTDTSHSLGADTARHFGADYQVNAISGHGVVRNYDGGAGDPVPVAYPFLLLDTQQRYADPGWHPQVLVVSLGTNDFSKPLKPAERWKTRDDLHADYEQTYVRFVQQLRSRDPGALIVLWATDLVNGEIAAETGRVVQELHSAGDSRVDGVVVRELAMSACDYHPSAADDRQISARLVEDIEAHPDVWQGAAPSAALAAAVP